MDLEESVPVEKPEAEKVRFTHNELLEITNKTLSDLISCDSLIKDLPHDPTLDEINAQLALHHGQSITVIVKKDNNEKLPIVVHHGATVSDLKKAIRRYVALSLRRKGDNTKISWKYVWKENNLKSGSVILEEDRAKLNDCGIVNGSKVTFVKRFRQKNSIKYSKSKRVNY
ncbi:U11/U12 small nuclear ribonucleoprotein 25 kDa protein-like [Cimex lectularius]|uniref:SNRNP25 ubiquitin-like domain-containing protein n=1 Tax=Cimex lectularius TaxID=79782 RepID=A0A8I6RWG2_CIMLE|nr:U11/U12 small nuclear ribonucleoprotein 25 kDa protein-like [Cimex lectularius]